jgi:hypothetical protein
MSTRWYLLFESNAQCLDATAVSKQCDSSAEQMNRTLHYEKLLNSPLSRGNSSAIQVDHVSCQKSPWNLSGNLRIEPKLFGWLWVYGRIAGNFFAAINDPVV